MKYFFLHNEKREYVKHNKTITLPKNFVYFNTDEKKINDSLTTYAHTSVKTSSWDSTLAHEQQSVNHITYK